jgi:thiamine-phosphate pyrophosphorylase
VNAQRAEARLVAVTDLQVLEASALEARLGRLCREATAGSVVVLLRDHTVSVRQRLALGRNLRQLTAATGQQLWVADRLDLALLLEADGVHLGEASVTAAAARRLVGPGRSVSRAWHGDSLVDAPEAELGEVDALLISPVLAARHGRPALGLATLARLAESARALPRSPALFALGGVGAADVAACRAAGATGIAAIGAALTGDLPSLLTALQVHART